MVKIRLSRKGLKKKPFYRVVVIDSRYSRDSGNFIERLGFFNPLTRDNSQRIFLNIPRISFWVLRGAVVSKRVGKLIGLYKRNIDNNANVL